MYTELLYCVRGYTKRNQNPTTPSWALDLEASVLFPEGGPKRFYYTLLSIWYILRMPIRGLEYTEHTVHRDCNQLALGTTVLHLCHDGHPGRPQHRHQCTQIRWYACDHSEMSLSTRSNPWSIQRDTWWSQGSSFGNHVT